MKKRENRIFTILLVLSIAFLILAISFRVRVYESKTYTKRNDIAMYIIKYRHLPSNYILQEDNTYDTTVEAIANGYAFGGKVFRYEGPITKYTKNTDLKEADYYPDVEEIIASEGRGPYRFVYTNSGRFELFYTDNHYESFHRLTVFKINLFSNIMWICFIQTFSGSLAMIIIFQVESNRKEKRYERSNN